MFFKFIGTILLKRYNSFKYLHEKNKNNNDTMMHIILSLIVFINNVVFIDFIFPYRYFN